MNTKSAPELVNLGHALYEVGDFPNARKLFERAVDGDPAHAIAHFNLGCTLDELRDYAGAIREYKRALELAPGYADAHYNLALTLERQGESRRALIHWRKYLRSDPSGPWADQARSRIRICVKRDPLEIVWRRGQATPAVTPEPEVADDVACDEPGQLSLF